MWFLAPSLKTGICHVRQACSWCGPALPRGRDRAHARAHVLPAEMEIFREVEQDENVIGRIATAQREELEQETAGLQTEARAREEEIEELVATLPF